MEGPFVSAMRGDRCGAYESGTGVDVSTSGIVAGVAGATVQCHHPACHPRQVRVCIRQPLDLLQGGHPEWQLDNTAAHLRRCDGRLHVAQRLADILYSIWSVDPWRTQILTPSSRRSQVASWLNSGAAVHWLH